MNANELADWILDEVRYADEAEEIATMLRQQQAEIEALKDLVEVMRMGQPNVDYDKELLKPTFVGRELTDEEIEEVMTEVGVPSDYHGNFMNFFQKVIKAILRKAQEK